MSQPRGAAFDSWARGLVERPELEPTDMYTYTTQSQDLLALAPLSERTFLDQVIGKSFIWLSSWKIFRVRTFIVLSIANWKCQTLTISTDKRKDWDARWLNQIIKSRIEMIVRAVLIFLIVVLLSTPTMILALLAERHYIQFLVVAMYTMIFSICLSSTTSARRQEQFAICAAVGFELESS